MRRGAGPAGSAGVVPVALSGVVARARHTADRRGDCGTGSGTGLLPPPGLPSPVRGQTKTVGPRSGHSGHNVSAHGGSTRDTRIRGGGDGDSDGGVRSSGIVSSRAGSRGSSSREGGPRNACGNRSGSGSGGALEGGAQRVIKNRPPGPPLSQVSLTLTPTVAVPSSRVSCSRVCHV